MSAGTQEHSQLLIIDTTAEGTPTEPEHFNARLQMGVAKALNLPLDVVKAAWTAVDLTQANMAYPVGATYISPLTIYERELNEVESILQQRGQTLKGMQTILVYDEDVEGCHAIDVGFAVRVFIRTKVAPAAMGLQYDNELGQWLNTDIIPLPSEQALDE
jgi:hypothetical protein